MGFLGDTLGCLPGLSCILQIGSGIEQKKECRDDEGLQGWRGGGLLVGRHCYAGLGKLP